jgi:tRNA(Ile)-lysidine synthase
MRPLLAYSKEEMLQYLQSNGHPYFVDVSNRDESYERNKFRKQFSDALMAEYKEGIQRSIEYLRKDKETLESGFEILYSNKLLHIVKLHTPTAKVKAADLTLKKLGYLLSASQRQEIEKESSLVIGGEWAVALQDDLLFIAPYLTVDMPKKFKEVCRVLKVPGKIRPYLFKEHIDPSRITFN